MSIYNLQQEDDDQAAIDYLQHEVEVLYGEIDAWKFAALCCLAGIVGTPQNGYRAADGLAEFKSDAHKMQREFKAMRNVLQRIAHKNEWFMSPDGSRKWKSDVSFSDQEVRELCELAGTEVPPEVGTWAAP